MDIATLAGGLAAAHQPTAELEAPRTGLRAPTAAPAAVTRLRLGSPEMAAAGGSAFAPMPASSGFLPRAAAIASAARGYAAAATSTSTAAPARAGAKPSAAAAGKTPPKPGSSSSSKKTTPKTASPATTSFTSQELSFLKDKRLSVEEKLFRFMTLLVQKGDQQLVDTMNAYAGKAPTSSSGATSTSSARGSSSAKGGAASGAKADGGGFAKELAAQLGGPLLAAAATAFGAPELAPAALQIGGKVGEAVVDLGGEALDAIGSLFGGGDGGLTDVVGKLLRGPGVAPAPAHDAAGGAAGTAGSTSGGTSSGGAGSSSGATAAGGSELDEKLVMLDLQRLVEKQNVMFSALSNVLKAMHDGQMTAVQNIR